MGAASAMWFCARNPRRVQAAVHIAPALFLRESFEQRLGEEGVRRWCREGSLLFEGDLVSAELDWELMADLRRHPTPQLAASYRTPTLLLVGQKDGGFKISFRSRCKMDCSQVAEQFGGGGHKAAAGAFSNEPFEVAQAKVLEAVRAAM